MEEEKRKFLERFLEVMEILGYTGFGRQTRLAAYYRLKQPSTKKWFDGTAIPSYPICVDLSRRANVNFDWFMTGRGKKRLDSATVPADPVIVAAIDLLGSMDEAERKTALQVLHVLARAAAGRTKR